MGEIDTLIRDVDDAILRGTIVGRSRSLSLLADLLVREDGHLGQQQIDLFDDVLGRFAGTVESAAKADFAEKIADLRHAPRGVLRTLALDESEAVATPILVRSRQLDEDDLIAAAAYGYPHRRAICRRPTIAERVTDVLVRHGERDVHLAVAEHQGAVLSPDSIGTLIDRSRDDEALQVSLGSRHDLTADALDRLVEVARDHARRQILADMGGATIDDDGALQSDAPEPARPTAATRDRRDFYRAAVTIRAFAQRRAVTEADLLAFATRGQQAEVICLISGLAGMSVAAAERLCDGGDLDRLLLVAKAHDWSWPTFTAILAQFWRIGPADRQLRLIEARFVAMTGEKARRALKDQADVVPGPRRRAVH